MQKAQGPGVCKLPKPPALSLSHRVHKTVLYISVSFAVSYTCQAKYDEIKKVVKQASEGPLKGILGYTEDQVQSVGQGTGVCMAPGSQAGFHMMPLRIRDTVEF